MVAGRAFMALANTRRRQPTAWAELIFAFACRPDQPGCPDPEPANAALCPDPVLFIIGAETGQAEEYLAKPPQAASGGGHLPLGQCSGQGLLNPPPSKLNTTAHGPQYTNQTMLSNQCEAIAQTINEAIAQTSIRDLIKQSIIRQSIKQSVKHYIIGKNKDRRGVDRTVRPSNVQFGRKT